MIIRSFQLNDFDDVSQLFEDVLTEKDADETKAFFAKQLSWDSELILVAQLDDAVTGLVIGTIEQSQGYVYRILVSKKHRQKGIGKALIHGLNERFGFRKVNKVCVAGDTYNERISSFFQKIGFTHTDFYPLFQEG